MEDLIRCVFQCRGSHRPKPAIWRPVVPTKHPGVVKVHSPEHLKHLQLRFFVGGPLAIAAMHLLS